MERPAGRPLNVLIATIGSLGDVYPFASLGLALKERGHRVSIATTGNYERFVLDLGLEFIELASGESFRMNTLNPNIRKRSRRFIATCIRPLYEIISKHFTEGDTILIGTTRMYGARVAHDKLGIPFVSIDCQPSSIRSVYDSPGLPLGNPPKFLGPAGRAWRAMQFRIIDELYSRPILEPALNSLRAELGLSPVRRPVQGWMHSPQLCIGLYPQWFASPQPDWPRPLHLTGFPRFDDSMKEMPAEVVKFLEDGTSPVVFTFGTEFRFAHRLLRESAAACVRGGFRGILLTRYPDQVPGDLPDGVRHFAYVPLSLLLPRCMAIVHAGGIGTTASALRAGVPQVVVPHGHDQPDNGARLKRLGVATVVSQRSYLAKLIASLVKDLTSSNHVIQSCARYRELMSTDDPLPQTCELIEEMMAIPQRDAP